jgi:hypothetical protein
MPRPIMSSCTVMYGHIPTVEAVEWTMSGKDSHIVRTDWK